MLFDAAIVVHLALSVPIARRFWRLAPRDTSFFGFWLKMQLGAGGWWVKPDEWPEMWQAQRWNRALIVAVLVTFVVVNLLAGFFSGRW